MKKYLGRDSCKQRRLLLAALRSTSHRNRGGTLLYKRLLVKMQSSLVQTFWAMFSRTVGHDTHRTIFGIWGHTWPMYDFWHSHSSDFSCIELHGEPPANLSGAALDVTHLVSSVGSNTDKSYFKYLFHYPGNPIMTAVNCKPGDYLIVYCHTHHTLKKQRTNIREKI